MSEATFVRINSTSEVLFYFIYFFTLSIRSIDGCNYTKQDRYAIQKIKICRNFYTKFEWTLLPTNLTKQLKPEYIIKGNENNEQV